MKKQIVANFKMGQTPQESKNWLISFLAKANEEAADITLCLPFTSLAIANLMLDGRKTRLGAQNLCDEENGKCTGEISGRMLVESGVKTVIVGHSDRRAKFKENSRLINKKIKIALKNRLNIILCVGESLAEKNTLKTLETIRAQIEEALKGLYENELENVTIAYEPIWAIGSGKNATVKEIEYAVKVIRKVLADDFSEKAGAQTQVIYGGSVTNKNISSIIKAQGLNGVMIGSGCEDVAGFVNMISCI